MIVAVTLASDMRVRGLINYCLTEIVFIYQATYEKSILMK